MPKQRPRSGLPSAALGALLLGLGLPWPAFGAGSPRPSAAAVQAFATRVRSALEHYQAHDYAAALAGFEAALAAAPAGADRASLEFNIAACEHQLGRYRAAEARFAALAQREPDERSRAWLHAGLSALGAGDLERAGHYLGMLRGPGAVLEDRESLRAAIDLHRRESFQRALRRGLQAYDKGDLAAAEAALREAEPHEPGSSAEARATRYHVLGLIARERGDLALARRHWTRSAELDPASGEAYAALGELAEAQDDRALAAAHYQRSLEAGLGPADSSAVQNALESLYLLPARGVAAWGAISAGWDSNAHQSGSRESLGFADQPPQGSAFSAPAWGLEVRHRAGLQIAIVPYYRGDWLLFLADGARDVSLQRHEAGAGLHYAATPALRLHVGAGAGVTYSGLDLEPFSLDGLAQGRIEYRPSRWLSSALSLEFRPERGLGAQQYLSGWRTDAALRGQYDRGRWLWGLELGLRRNDIGTQHLEIGPSPLPFCNFAGCQGAEYEIPLGYQGPFLGGSASFAITPALLLAAYGRFEHRAYLGESALRGSLVPAGLEELSRKRRRDERFLSGARARYRFRSDPGVYGWLDYAARISRSNMAAGQAGLEHAFDYDDRNFTQHTVELGVEFRL